MKIGKVDVPPVYVKDYKAIHNKAKQFFNEPHEQVGKPRLDVDTTLDIFEIVLKKIRMWKNSADYTKEIDNLLNIKG